MAYLKDVQKIYKVYEQAVTEGRVWKRDYPEFERLMDNGLLDDLDENLPEVNDGSLAAALFKLPKRIVNTDLKGRAKAVNRDEAWLTEIANMQWENEIIPNANSQAPFHRKWKDAVRKSAGYGGIPLITLFVERGNYTGADFIVAQAGDVHLEPGKVSDNDSDVIFWDVYFTELQLKDMLKQAQSEVKDKKSDGYNKWDIAALKEILADKNAGEEERPTEDEHKGRSGKSVTKGGYHFCIVFQRGVDSPFYMFYKSGKKKIREWTNPDPTGDLPVHYLYCYQDFINPYGIGIVKLAGGTQNVLDYMRQADVLATQIGVRPPINIAGNTDRTDLDSIVYAQDQQWITGDAVVKREEISNQVYQALPNRIAMYKTSLNQLLPMGDTSIAASAGDPQYSKTPAGVKFQAANLSIDDEDFKDNLYMTYAAVAKSMINYHFANMQGNDLMKLDDEQRDILDKAGIPFPIDEEGEPSNQLEIAWDEARAEFDFSVDPEQDKAKDDEKRLEGLLKVAEFKASDPMFDQKLLVSGYKLNDGELYSEIINLTTDNDKIIEQVDPEEQAQMEGGAPGQEGAPQDEEMVNRQAIMQAHGVPENIAAAMLEAERQGFDPEEILAAAQKHVTLPQLPEPQGVPSAA